LHSPGKGKFSGKTEVAAIIDILRIQRGIQTVKLNMGRCLERGFPFRRFGKDFVQGRLFPAFLLFSNIFRHASLRFKRVQGFEGSWVRVFFAMIY
jgi:hypothetical protein